jgi:hypothetical protein
MGGSFFGCRLPVCCPLRVICCSPVGAVIFAIPNNQHHCTGYCPGSMISPARHGTVPDVRPDAVKWPTHAEIGRRYVYKLAAAHLILDLLAQLREVVLGGELSNLVRLIRQLITHSSSPEQQSHCCRQQCQRQLPGSSQHHPVSHWTKAKGGLRRDRERALHQRRKNSGVARRWIAGRSLCRPSSLAQSTIKPRPGKDRGIFGEEHQERTNPYMPLWRC